MTPARAVVRTRSGRLLESTDERMDLRIRASIPWWVFAAVPAAVLCALWRATTTEAFGAGEAAILWTLVTWAPFLVLPFLALRWTGLVVPKRRLVVERIHGEDYRRPGTFLATVDGAAIGPSAERRLVEVRLYNITAHVLILGERAILLQRFVEVDKSPEDPGREEASLALLRADRGPRGDRPVPSTVPCIHALSRVLDLNPNDTGGDALSRDYERAGRTREFGASFPELMLPTKGTLLIAAAILLAPLWNVVAWIGVLPLVGRLPLLAGALLFAVALVVPVVALFHGVHRFVYGRPLDARIAAMIARARGPAERPQAAHPR